MKLEPKKLEWSSPFDKRGCNFGHRWEDAYPWFDTLDLEKDYQQILNRIAGGDLQRLVDKVENLQNEIQELKEKKGILVTESSLHEIWDDDGDDWWSED